MQPQSSLAIGGVSTLLFNGNPLLRFDGYYVLVDAIEIPNLAKRSGRHLAMLFQRYVLGLEEREGIPDQAHLIFTLAKQSTQQRIAEDTGFKAGKDATGVELIYATDREIVVNRTTVDETHGLKTIFIDKDDEKGIVRNIYAAPDADSADGNGAAIEEEDGKWQTFGGTTMPYAQIGFAIASPMFLLAEGTRTITITFTLDGNADFLPGDIPNGNGDSTIELELQGNVTVTASGEKEWLPLSVAASVDVVEDEEEGEDRISVIYTLSLGSDADAIIDYDADTLDGAFDTTFPVLRFMLENEAPPIRRWTVAQ